MTFKVEFMAKAHAGLARLFCFLLECAEIVERDGRLPEKLRVTGGGS